MSHEFTHFRTIAEDAKMSKDRRGGEEEGLIPFGVTFLDDVFHGIAPSDLILLGGRSGGGKTELAVHIAASAAMKGKKVYYFALEAEDHEVGDRLLYKKLCQFYFLDKEREKAFLSYDEWRSGKLKALDKYEQVALSELAAFSNLAVRYSHEGYHLENFERDVISTKNDADLILLDHLHYLDLDDDESNLAYKNAVKKIRSLALHYKKPIILISHIRKTDKRFSGLVPDQEDFHGSSDIIKIATKAITIASANEFFVGREAYLWPTFMRAVKYRRNGAKTFPICVINYDARKNVYEDEYALGTQSRKGNQVLFERFGLGQIPAWAKHHKPIEVPSGT